MSENPDYNAVSFVIRSNYRETTILALTDGFKTPSEIQDKTGTPLPHISRALTELRDEDMVELLNDESAQKGRLYALTENGRDVAGVIQDRNT